MGKFQGKKRACANLEAPIGTKQVQKQGVWCGWRVAHVAYVEGGEAEEAGGAGSGKDLCPTLRTQILYRKLQLY